jgi:2-(1,2-epoxy-1,2-dihydrophenyl)acetyl-CoA isomerase
MARCAREDAMTEPLVRVEIAGGIANVRLNRPDRLNALDFPMAEALLAAITQAERDPSVKVLTLTGEGRAFMAGGDVGVFYKAGENAPQEIGKLIELFHQIVRRIRRMKPPVICGVQGAVAGGGLGLAVACDIVIAADNASFVPAYTRLGTSPDGGTTWSITRLIGQRRALEWIMLGEQMDSAEAASIGLVNRVVPDNMLVEEVNALAQTIAAGPAFVFASVKRLVYRATGASFDEQLEAERDAFVAAAATKDFREGVAAFFERRPAKFGD